MQYARYIVKRWIYAIDWNYFLRNTAFSHLSEQLKYSVSVDRATRAYLVGRCRQHTHLRIRAIGMFYEKRMDKPATLHSLALRERGNGVIPKECSIETKIYLHWLNSGKH